MTAYELHIDESGDFEKRAEERTRAHEGEGKQARLIVGVLVPSKDAEERRDALRRLLEPVRAQYFPGASKITGVHLSELDGGERSSARRQLIAAFKRIGVGQIGVVYDVQELSEKTAPTGAHLYRNMLIQLLRAVVYFHPGLPDDARFDIRLAHRRVPYPLAYDRDLASQGYLKLREQGGKTWFTAITAADLQSILQNLRDSLRLKTARDASYAMKRYADWDDPYMVMADTVANVGLGIVGKLWADQGKSAAVFGQQLGHNTLVYLAPSDYDFPEELLTRFHLGDLAGFLKAYHQQSRMRSRGTRESDRLLLVPAVRRATETLRSQEEPALELCRTIVDFADEIYDQRQYALYGVVPDLLDVVRESVGKKEKDPHWGRIAYSYYNTLLRRANHTGNVEGARVAGVELEAAFERLPGRTLEDIRAHHECVNRMSVSDTNEFAFERALERLEKIRPLEEELTRLLGNPRNRILGAICGSMGQNKAFLGKHDEALALFKKADEHLGPGNFMQVSFMAHLAVDMRNEALYQESVVQLFQAGGGADGFDGYEPFVRICNDRPDDHPFDTHLVLKGMLTFDRASSRRLVPSIAAVVKDPWRTEHPWELVYATIAELLAEDAEQRGEAEDFWNAAQAFASRHRGAIALVMLGHAARATHALRLLAESNLAAALRLAGEIAVTFRGALPVGIYNADRRSGGAPGWFDDVGRRFAAGLPRERTELGQLLADFWSRFTFNYR